MMQRRGGGWWLGLYLLLAMGAVSVLAGHGGAILTLPGRVEAIRGGGKEGHSADISMTHPIKQGRWVHHWPWPSGSTEKKIEKRPTEGRKTTTEAYDDGGGATSSSKDGGESAGKPDGKGFLGGFRDAFSHIQTPGIKWDLRPERTKIKLRKRLYPLGMTRLTVGADYDPMGGEWSIKTSWKDTVIGGNLNIHGTEVALTKEFKMDDRNVLWLKAAYDWHTQKSLIGFTLKPLMGLSARTGSDRPGFSFIRRIPLNDNLQVEVDALVEMPEATYTTSSTTGMCLGIGDFKCDLRELNLVIEL